MRLWCLDSSCLNQPRVYSRARRPSSHTRGYVRRKCAVHTDTAILRGRPPPCAKPMPACARPPASLTKKTQADTEAVSQARNSGGGSDCRGPKVVRREEILGIPTTVRGVEHSTG